MNVISHAMIIYVLGLCTPTVDSKGEGNYRGLFYFFSGSCDCRCGRPNRGARILGGEVLRGFEFPWFASMQIRGGRSAQGTLISSKYVVTSASILMGLTPYDVKVTLGLFDRCHPDVSSTNYSVDAVVVHPDYSPTNSAHDIGLLRLIGEANFEKRVSPICLALPGKSYLGQVGTVFGWINAFVNDENVYCRPRKMGLPVLGWGECLVASPEAQHFSRDKGCVGVVGATSGVCKVDAGGPVMYRDYDGVYELIGILSDKNECGVNRPTTALYTTISSHLTWLKQNTKEGCYCYK